MTAYLSHPSRVPLAKLLKRCPFWPTILIFSLLCPTEFSFNAGPLRLSPYRLVLIFSLIPALKVIFSGMAGKVTSIDWLVLLNIIWGFVVIAFHHDVETAIESGGIRMLEFGGAYLIARVYINSYVSYSAIVALLLLIISILAPLTTLESVTGIHFIHEIASKLTGQNFYSSIEPRLGLARAYGPFDHPILYGVFAASLFSLAWMRTIPTGRRESIGWYVKLSVVVASLTSLSSGALASLGSQIFIMLWSRKMSNFRSKWKLLIFILIVLYLIIEIFSNRSAMMVFLTYLTFSSGTAYNRVTIFNWGIQDVYRNPVFGIGFNVWTRPEWMHSTSMDNFWLVQAVTFGVPGFLTMALCVVLLLFSGWNNLKGRYTNLRIAWIFTMTGTILASCTVHFWNNLFVYFSFLLGAGAWFINIQGQKAISERL